MIFLMVMVVLVIWIVSLRLPEPNERTVSHALVKEQILNTALGNAIWKDVEAHPDTSGVYMLTKPKDAFGARIKLAKAAQKTIDVQYYIWKNDTTGHLLLASLQEAANRGVRVRLLLDDHGTSGLDGILSVMDSHPNIEVRLFNPFAFRAFKPVGFLSDFQRANRRMHNKTFIVDNAAIILGGRNVGDEYFGATSGVVFADLDVLTIGKVTKEASASFDDYWKSQSSYALSQIVKPVAGSQVTEAVQSHQQKIADPDAQQYEEAVLNTPFVEDLLKGTLEFYWAPTKFIVDDVSKGLASIAPKKQLMTQMTEVMGHPKKSLDVISPYFVPTDSGTDYFVGLAKKGVKVRILTNSLVANDVLAVHSGYARHRKRLLQAGVLVYEMKPTSGALSKEEKGSGWMGSSGSSLHAKSFGMNDDRLFVGSFNFDPRSVNLNTELGVVIDSPNMRELMNQEFLNEVPRNSWELKYDVTTDALTWHALDKDEVWHEEPLSTWWQRSLVTFLSYLPIDWLL